MKWNELSMSQKAQYMKLAVSNGITNMDAIRDYYNQYAEGGDIQLPELVVTPRMNYTSYTGDETFSPTMQEYRQARREETRANALLDMQNTTMPTIPSLPSKTGRLFKRVAGDWFDDGDVKFIFGEDKEPDTCISTVSSKYNRIVPGNITLRDSHKSLGFVEIPESQRDHGDIVQTVGRRGVPSHAAMVSGFTKDGRMLIDESHGGITPSTIEHDIDYFDTDPDLKNKIYYRFVGNRQDKEQWNNEYRQKFGKKSHGGNLFDQGGQKKLITTGNEYGDIALGFVPFVGTAMDWEEAIRNPSVYNYTKAGISTVADLFGVSLIKGAVKGARAGYKMYKAGERIVPRASEIKEGIKYIPNSKDIKDFGRILFPVVNTEMEVLDNINKHNKKQH